MVQLIVIVGMLLSGLLTVLGGWSIDHGKLNREEAAAKIFKGVSSAKSLAEQNYQVTGKFEADRGYPTDGHGWTTNFPAAVPASQLPSKASAIALSGNGVPTKVAFDTGAADGTSGDIYWPRPAAYSIQCTTGKATSGADSSAFGPCTAATAAKGHRYLAVVFTNEDGTCTADAGGYLENLGGVLAGKAPNWASRWGTDAWVRGVSATATSGVSSTTTSSATSSSTGTSTTGSTATTSGPSTATASDTSSAGATVQPAATTPSSDPSSSVALGSSGLVMSPAAIDFGSSSVGGGAGTPALVTIKNNGASDVEVLTIVSTSANFTVDSSNCLAVLAPGDSCSVPAAFAPRSLGALTGALKVRLDDGGFYAGTSVKGTGAQGTPSVQVPPTFQFYDLALGVRSPVRTLTLKNVGQGNLKLSSIVKQGDAAFTLEGHNCPTTIAPSASCQISVSALVSDSQVHSANLVITTTLSSSPSVKMAMNARGVPGSPSLNTGSLDFGSVNIGSSSTLPLTLTNNGTDQFGITSMTLAGTAGNVFSISSSDCPSSLGAGASCTLQVKFTPISATSYSDSLDSEFTSASPASLVTALTGSGAQSTVSVPGVNGCPQLWVYLGKNTH